MADIARRGTQQAFANSTAVSSLGVSLPGAATAGDGIVVGIAKTGAIAPRVGGVTDNQGNTYTRDQIGAQLSGSAYVALFSALGINASGTFTITYDNAGVSVDMVIAAGEYSDMATVSAFDVGATGGSASTGNSETTSATAATSQANAVAIGFMTHDDSAETYTPGGGYSTVNTNGANGNVQVAMSMSDLILTTTGAQTATWTTNGTASTYDACVAVYRAGLAFRAKTHSVVSTTPGEPTGTVQGDDVFMWAITTSAGNPQPPAGWTILGTWNGTNSKFALWWIKRTGSAPSYAWTGNSGFFESSALTYKNRPSSSVPLIVANPARQINPQNPDCPAAAFAGVGSMILAFGGSWIGSVGAVWAPPSGYTIREDGVSIGNDLMAAEKLLLTAGIENPGAFSNGSATGDDVAEGTVTLLPADPNSAGGGLNPNKIYTRKTFGAQGTYL